MNIKIIKICFYDALNFIAYNANNKMIYFQLSSWLKNDIVRHAKDNHNFIITCFNPINITIITRNYFYRDGVLDLINKLFLIDEGLFCRNFERKDLK